MLDLPCDPARCDSASVKPCAHYAGCYLALAFVLFGGSNSLEATTVLIGYDVITTQRGFPLASRQHTLTGPPLPSFA